MMHKLRGNVWRHNSRDYNTKTHSNVNVKSKIDIYNKNECIFLHNFAHIVKFVYVFGRCSVRIPDRSQTAVTEALSLVTQSRQITLNQTPTISFKNQFVGLFRTFRIRGHVPGQSYIIFDASVYKRGKKCKKYIVPVCMTGVTYI